MITLGDIKIEIHDADHAMEKSVGAYITIRHAVPVRLLEEAKEARTYLGSSAATGKAIEECKRAIMNRIYGPELKAALETGRKYASYSGTQHELDNINRMLLMIQADPSPSPEPIAPVKHQRVSCPVDDGSTAIRNAIDSLESTLENTRDLLASHDVELGRTTRANQRIAEMYEEDIRKATEAVDGLKRLLPPDTPSAERKIVTENVTNIVDARA